MFHLLVCWIVEAPHYSGVPHVRQHFCPTLAFSFAFLFSAFLSRASGLGFRAFLRAALAFAALRAAPPLAAIKAQCSASVIGRLAMPE